MEGEEDYEGMTPEELAARNVEVFQQAIQSGQPPIPAEGGMGNAATDEGSG